MIPACIVLALVIVPAFVMANHNDYYYGASHIFGPGTQVGDEKAEIEEVFGVGDTYAVMVPKGDNVREKELITALKAYPQVKNVRSYGETLSAVIPSEVLPDSLAGLLISEHYSRIVLSMETEYEGEETFQLVQDLRKTCEEYYGDDWYLAGEGVSTYDLMDTVTSDLLKINLAAVIAVFLVLVLLFRKILLPILLVFSIETAIWINVAIPGVMGDPVFYIAYLIISAVQLGATVDYAILLTTRYRENRMGSPEEGRPGLEKGAAVVETIRNVTASIGTSGTGAASSAPRLR